MDHQSRPRFSLAASLVRLSVRRRLMPRDMAEWRAMLENLDALGEMRESVRCGRNRGMKRLNLPVDLSQTKQVNCYEEFELDLLEISVLE